MQGRSSVKGIVALAVFLAIICFIMLGLADYGYPQSGGITIIYDIESGRGIVFINASTKSIYSTIICFPSKDMALLYADDGHVDAVTYREIRNGLLKTYNASSVLSFIIPQTEKTSGIQY